jgi:hypothetical protein
MSRIKSTENPLTLSLGKPRDKQLKRTEDPLPKTGYVNWLLVGNKGSGKSTIILNALHHKDAYKGFFDSIFIVSPTAGRDDKFKKLVKENKHYTECTPAVVEEIMDEIQEWNDDFKKEQDALKKKEGKDFVPEPAPHHLIIFDDCIADLPKSSQRSIINRLYTCNRHYKTSIWTASQKLKAINPLIRTNCDLLSLWRVESNTEKKGILDEFSIPEEVYDYATEQANSFLHVSLFSGKPIFFKKFDRIVIE